MSKDYIRCGDRRCGWIGTWGEVPFAPNPFDPADTLHACPLCKTIDNSDECEVTSLSEEPEFAGETTLDDFGYFLPTE